MKKRLISALLCAVLLLSVGITAGASSSYPMTYQPGTADAVTGLPAEGSITAGEAYTVASGIPQREGYEFLDWELDYGKAYTLNYVVFGDPTYGTPGDTSTPASVTGIHAGSDVTLAAPLVSQWEGDKSKELPGADTASYMVHHIVLGRGELATETGTAPVGEPLTVYVSVDDEGRLMDPYTHETFEIIYPEYEPDRFSYYWPMHPYEKTNESMPRTKFGKWTFTGWCSDEACTNPITGITAISEDTTVYGKWVYSVVDKPVEFTFLYRQNGLGG